MSTQATTPQVADDPHVHLLGDTWFLTIFAVLLATALPWFVSSFDIDFGRASLGLFALGVIYVLLSNDAVLKGVSDVWRKRATASLHVAGVGVLGFIWLHAGGAANPVFLLAFVMPVVGATFISRRQPYLSAALALIAVFVVVLIQEPELRWYVSGFGSVGASLVAFFGGEGSRGSSPVPGFDAPFAYLSVVLEVFAVLLFSCAIAADYVGTVFERLRTQATAARAEAARGQEMWATVTEHLPVPAFLINADTLRVICVSENASEIVSGGESPVGHAFFEAVRFSYPDVVQNLIEGTGGGIPDAVVRVAGEPRTVEVSVGHIPYTDHRFALVVLRDVTDAMCVKTALDMADHAALVIDERGDVKAFNKPALGLFPGTSAGTKVVGLLSPAGWGTAWWQAGTRRRKAIVEIRQRCYEVTCASVALPGEDESLHVVALRPVAKKQSGNGFASASAPPKSTEVESR
jgi:hypothetical protein